MFAPQVIAQREARLLADPRFAAQFPKGLPRSSVTTSQANAQTLAALVDDKGALKRALTPEESAFVTAERLVSKIDFRYFAERYVMIRKASSTGQRLKPLYPLWESQELLLSRIAAREQEIRETHDPDGVLVTVLKARQLGVCLIPSTRVLTADLQWVAIDDLRVGDALVAVDEHPASPSAGKWKRTARRMRTAYVEGKGDRIHGTIMLTLDTGVTLTATPQHPFLCRRRGYKDLVWRQTGEIRVGDDIRKITDVWEPGDMQDAWLSGLIDGEGCLREKDKAGVELSIAQIAGAVLERARTLLYSRYSHVREEIDRRVGGSSSKLGNQPVYKLVVGRLAELFPLLGRTRPTRFAGRRWWENKELPGKHVGHQWARVVAVAPAGRQRVVDLQTSTGTFVAEGIVSHNTSFGMAALLHRSVTTSYQSGLIAADVTEQSGYMFNDLFLSMLEHLPWYLKPQVLSCTTAGEKRHVYWANHSIVRMSSGKSMRGKLQEESGTKKGNIGRGRTQGLFHLSEIPSWEYPEQIDTALEPGIPVMQDTFGIMEATAKGREDYFHQHWRASVAREGRFIAVFIPWWAEAKKYSLPAPAGWSPALPTLQHARRAELSAPEILGHAVSLTRDQLYWYERRKSAMAKANRLSEFLEEYPAEPEEAFQRSGHSIFSAEEIDRLQSLARPLTSAYEFDPDALAQVLP